MAQTPISPQGIHLEDIFIFLKAVSRKYVTAKGITAAAWIASYNMRLFILEFVRSCNTGKGKIWANAVEAAI